MTKPFLSLHQVSFKYSNASHPIINELSCQFEQGWTGIVGANGCGKTTLLKLLTGMLQPASGRIRLPDDMIYCQQRTDTPPENLSRFIEDYSSEAFRLKSQLKIKDEWAGRWESLSHGERKKLQLGSALFQSPGILALDEPGNHIDINAKTQLQQVLASFSGIGLLVSHDRQLLDTLCSHTLYMTQKNIILRRGNYSTTIDDLQKDQAFQAHQAEQVKRRIKKLHREIVDRSQKAAQADAKRSKKNIHRKDHDAKSKVDLARLSGKDATEGRIKHRLDSQMRRMKAEQNRINWNKTAPSGIRVNSVQKNTGALLHFSPADLSIGKQTLTIPDLMINSSERMGVVGRNGSGKSTLIRHLISQINLTAVETIYIPQERKASASQSILSEIKTLPKDKLAMLMTLISRLGSEPEQLLESMMPSPGEMRKLMLAIGLQKNPQLIIMDEPTNHLDLPSIVMMEEALNACSSAMILVSHDKAFLTNLQVEFWEISIDRKLRRKG